MAWERPVLNIPAAIAGASFATGNGYNSTGQFLFVKLSADDTYIPCTSTRDLPVGISQNNPASGDGLEVMVYGVSKVFVGSGGLAYGDEVGSDSQGKGVKKSNTATGANFGDAVRGICIEAGAAGALATVLLTGPYYVGHPT